MVETGLLCFTFSVPEVAGQTSIEMQSRIMGSTFSFTSVVNVNAHWYKMLLWKTLPEFDMIQFDMTKNNFEMSAILFFEFDDSTTIESHFNIVPGNTQKTIF